MTVDVVVVGGGVIGKAISYELGKRDVCVSCVSLDHFSAGSASTAAGAMLGVLGEVTAAADTALDHDELHFRGAAGKRYPEFLARLAEDSSVHVSAGRGTFIVGNAVNEADWKNVAAIQAAAGELGLRFETVDPRAVPGLRPARGYEPVATMFLPDEGFLDSWRLMEALEAAMDRMGHVTLVRAEAQSVVTGHNRVAGVRLADGSLIKASHVILANGVGVQPLLDDLGPLAGTLPRLLPGKGVSLVVDNVDDTFPHVIRTPNRDFACGSHVVPRGGGSLYLGATNRVSATPGSSPSVTPGEVHGLLHSLIHEINVRIRTASLSTQRYGLRPLASDGYPLVGPTAIDGLSVATGTYRNGILMAPAIAEVIAALVTGTEPAVANPFWPLADFRTAGTRPPVEQIMDEGMRYLASFILEPGGSLPYDRQRELRSFITSLGRLALSDGAETEQMRAEMRSMFEAYPIVEMVPHLYYLLVDQSAGNEE